MLAIAMRRIITGAVLLMAVPCAAAEDHDQKPANEAAISGRAFLYPAIYHTGKNMVSLERKKWSYTHPLKGYEMKFVPSHPFQKNRTSLYIASTVTSPNYWVYSPLELKGGHKYLVGAWVRNLNAKLLVRIVGTAKDNSGVRDFDQRLYYMKGINTLVAPYLPQEVIDHFAGGSGGWQIVYRIVEVPDTFAAVHAALHIGSYLSTGTIYAADPVVVDVTNNANWRLSVDIQTDGIRKLKSIRVFEQNTRDDVFMRQFSPPVESFRAEIPKTDFSRGMDNKVIEGYGLAVEYSDDAREVFYAPKDKIQSDR
jgi:hypothetical protein